MCRIGDVVGRHSRAALVGGEDQQIADEERVADDAGEPEMVPGSQDDTVALDRRQTADGAVAPPGVADEERLEEAATDAGAEQVG